MPPKLCTPRLREQLRAFGLGPDADADEALALAKRLLKDGTIDPALFVEWSTDVANDDAGDQIARHEAALAFARSATRTVSIPGGAGNLPALEKQAARVARERTPARPHTAFERHAARMATMPDSAVQPDDLIPAGAAKRGTNNGGSDRNSLSTRQ